MGNIRCCLVVIWGHFINIFKWLRSVWEQKIFLSLSSPFLFNLVVYSFCLASVGFNFRYMSLLFAQYSWNVEPEAKRVLQHSSAWICRIVILFIFTLVLQFFFLSSTSYSLLIICNCATVSVYISVTAQSHSLFGIHSLYRMDVCSRAHSTICRESTGWKRNGEKNHVKCNDNHNILFSRLLFI